MFNKNNTVTLVIDGKNNTVSAFRSVEGDLTKLSDSAKNTGLSINAIGGLLKAALGGLSVGGAIYGIYKFMNSIIDTADEINKLSQKVGISVESLSTLEYAAKLSDVSIEELRTGLAILNRNIYEASTGSGEITKAFFELGVVTVDANNKIRPTESILNDIIKVFSEMPDSVEKTALSMKLFGRSGAEWIPLMNQGAEGIKKLQEEAKKLGYQLTTETAQAAENFNDDLTRLSSSFQGAGNQILIALMPSLKGLAKFLIDDVAPVIKSGSESISKWIIAFQELGKEVKKVTELPEWKILKFMMDNLNIMGFITGGQGVQYVKMDKFYSDYPITPAQMKAIRETRELLTDIYGPPAPTAEQKQWIDSWLTLNDTFQIDLELNNKIMKAGTDALLDSLIRGEDIRHRNYEKEKELKKISDQINFENSLVGLSAFERKLVELKNKVDKWRSEFGDKSIFGSYFATQQGGLIKEMLDSSEEEMRQDAYDENQLFLKGLDEEIYALVEFYRLKKIFRLDDFEDAKLKREQEIQAEIMKLDIYASILSSMSSLAYTFYSSSAEMSASSFALYKTFAVGETMISTIASAQKAYESVVATPFLGPSIAPIAAAAAYAAGMARVAAILAQRPGSSSGGGSGGTSRFSIPSSVQNNSYSTMNNNNESKTINQNITLSINGTPVEVDEWFRKNAGALKRLFQDGVIDFKKLG